MREENIEDSKLTTLPQLSSDTLLGSECHPAPMREHETKKKAVLEVRQNTQEGFRQCHKIHYGTCVPLSHFPKK